MDWSVQATNRDRRLWGWAIGSSLVINALVMLAYGWSVLPTLMMEAKTKAVETLAAAQSAPQFSALQILPTAVAPAAAASEEKAHAPVPDVALREKRPHDFARTAPEQAAERPAQPAFLGELNTQAASELPPDPSAPPLPAQRGVEQPFVETTQSRYRDGELEEKAESGKLKAEMEKEEKAEMEQPAPIKGQTLPEGMVRTGGAQEGSPAAPDAGAAAPKETLAQGTQSIDVAKPEESREGRQDRERREAAQRLSAAQAAAAAPNALPEKTSVPAAAGAPGEKKPRPLGPGFRGHSRKTQLRGSIKRSGMSALDVADSPLGRYQAQVARAIEKEWQLQCTKHRDLITPGFLTMRFSIGAQGKLVGAVTTDLDGSSNKDSGKIQEGFTIQAIRIAKLPPMSDAVRKELGEEPLELIFNFYF